MFCGKVICGFSRWMGWGIGEVVRVEVNISFVLYGLFVIRFFGKGL